MGFCHPTAMGSVDKADAAAQNTAVRGLCTATSNVMDHPPPIHNNNLLKPPCQLLIDEMLIGRRASETTEAAARSRHVNSPENRIRLPLSTKPTAGKS